MKDKEDARNIHYGNNYYDSTHYERKMRDNYGEIIEGDKNEYGIPLDEFNKLIQKIQELNSDSQKELKGRCHS